MRSIRSKIILLTACAIIVAVLVTATFSIISIYNIGNEKTRQLLALMCETGEKNLDRYFESVEQSVDIVSSFINTDLKTTAPEQLSEHVERTKDVFSRAAAKAPGVLTYYYRIDPEVSEEEKGYWYTNLDGEGFAPHEVTDITLYDTADTSSLVWFTVPKYEGRSVWLPSYYTDSLDKVHVISYNAPVYRDDTFIGVVGIEIDYWVLASQVDSIRLYKSGYAFVNNPDGKIVYHPNVNVLELAEEDKLNTPEGIKSSGSIVHYEFQGVKRVAACLPLRIGLRLYVTVPVEEINREWKTLANEITISVVIILVAFAVLTVVFSQHITKPIREITEIAKQIDEGNYSVRMGVYKGDDEIGTLSRTMNRLVDHLSGYIHDLTDMAYGDALTAVQNKSAFDLHISEIEEQLTGTDERIRFAIGIFDCDNLKPINDRYGHEKGNIYLKNACHLICRVFRNSLVFRIGGDEFAVILQGHDYENRAALEKTFFEKSAEISTFAKEPWERISVSAGIAEYDPSVDRTAADVFNRADHLMYENKRERKQGRDPK